MPDHKPHKILVADDNKMNQRVIQELLRHKGYHVEVVDGGHEAIAALKEGAFDLLILDCLMPGLNGFATARVIRNSDPTTINTGIPILAITALASKQDHDRCLQAGMNEYLRKPIQAESLFNCVEKLIATQAAGSTRIRPEACTENVSPNFQQIVNSMSDRLLSDLRDWEMSLETLFEKRDWEKIRNLAHKIRGTADIVEFRELSENAAALELYAAEEDEPAVAKYMKALVNGLREMTRELSKK